LRAAELKIEQQQQLGVNFYALSVEMDSVIELQRQTHEEVERFERALYTLLSRPQPSHDARLRTEHRASQILDRVSSRVSILNSSYQDEDARKLELDALSAPPQANDLSEFYSRLVKIQEHHSKYPDSVAGGFDLELAALLEEPDPENGDDEYEEEDRAYLSLSSPPPFSSCVSTAISLLFSGEEGYGKYLDLYANHTAFNNLKNIGKRPGYLQYLDLLLVAQNEPIHQDLSKETRITKDFETCVNC
jgi:splicing factor 3A subunit 3